MSNAPQTHLEEGQKLTADALVDLFEMTLINGSFVRFRDGPPGGTTTYGGKVYEHIPLKFSGMSQSADEEKSRPTLTAFNPSGIWNKYAKQGLFEKGSVINYRVLRAHLDANVQIFATRIWYIGRVPSTVANQGLTIELRSLGDGPQQLIPVRMYAPPEFPFVTLG